MLRRRPFRPRRPVFTWRSLGFEVLVVVLGVLIALGVNEARERWRDRRKATMLGEALHAEYETNCRRFSEGRAYHRPMIAELDSLIAHDPAASSPSQLPSAHNGIGPVFPATSVYQTAQSTGDISLLGFRVALGLGQINAINDLYRESVSRVLDAISTREVLLVDVEQPFKIMYELEEAARVANCNAYRGLGARTGAPVDSALVAGVPDTY